MAEIGEPVLDGRYVLLRHVRGCIGGTRTVLGKRGVCRYCGGRDSKTFRKTAHAIPEGLGNRWIISGDECDTCNGAFSLYEDALVNSVSPFLTLGGTTGKTNKVRQTGRTAGDAVITHHGSGLSMRSKSVQPKDHVTFDRTSGRFRLAIPVAGVPFRPRHAYKALSKMGVALLPDDELDNYRKLRSWLLDVRDTLDFPVLDVAMSFSSIGNAPPLVMASLLRRTSPDDEIPHMLFILCAGSVCLQIDLMSDHLEDHIPPTPMGCVNIDWSVVLGGGGRQSSHRNQLWHSNTPELVLEGDQATADRNYDPRFQSADPRRTLHAGVPRRGYVSLNRRRAVKPR